MEILNATCGVDSTVDIINPYPHTCEWYRMGIDSDSHLPIKSLNSIQCINPEHTFNFQLDINQHVQNTPQFSLIYLFGGHSSLKANYLQHSIDNSLFHFLQTINFQKSILFLTSDHGLHFGPHLNSLQGRFIAKIIVIIMKDKKNICCLC